MGNAFRNGQYDELRKNEEFMQEFGQIYRRTSQDNYLLVYTVEWVKRVSH